jgi:hypothetical protein
MAVGDEMNWAAGCCPKLADRKPGGISEILYFASMRDTLGTQISKRGDRQRVRRMIRSNGVAISFERVPSRDEHMLDLSHEAI